MNKPGRHQTIHSSLKHQIATIAAVTGVDRVIIGPSRGVRHNRPVGSIRIQTNLLTGIRLVGYSDRGISTFTVITSDTETVRDRLETLYGERRHGI
jgi:hypothetical protein